MTPHAPGYVTAQHLAEAVEAHRAALGAAARVAFVLPPGGAAGAYQAGALEALAEHGVRPDLVVGTSSGALNGLGVVLDALAPVRRPTSWPAGRPGRLWRTLSDPATGPGLLVDKPNLLAWIGGRPGMSGLAGEAFGHLTHLRSLQDGLFQLGPLRRLLVGAIDRATACPDQTPDAAGHALVDTWAARHAAGSRPPELIVLATDIQSHDAIPFVLGTPALAELLFHHGHPVRALGHGPLTGGLVVEAFMASAAIPGAFPAVTLPAAVAGWPDRRLVDGAVAASEPFHLAIDAGATFIVSLEVMPFLRPPRPVAEEGPWPGLAAEALLAIQARYLKADARGVASWNLRLAATHALGRREVPLYRLAPTRQGLGVLGFAGRWQGDALATSVFDWFMDGYGDAGGSAPQAWVSYVREGEAHGDTGEAAARGLVSGFWDATRQAAPRGAGASAEARVGPGAGLQG